MCSVVTQGISQQIISPLQFALTLASHRWLADRVRAGAVEPQVGLRVQQEWTYQVRPRPPGEINRKSPLLHFTRPRRSPPPFVVTLLNTSARRDFYGPSVADSRQHKCFIPYVEYGFFSWEGSRCLVSSTDFLTGKAGDILASRSRKTLGWTLT